LIGNICKSPHCTYIKNIHFTSTYKITLDAGFIFIKNVRVTKHSPIRLDRQICVRLFTRFPIYTLHTHTHTHWYTHTDKDIDTQTRIHTMVLTPLLCIYTYNSGPMAVVMRGRPWPVVSSSGVRGCRSRRALCRAVRAEYVPWKRSYVIQTSNYGAD